MFKQKTFELSDKEIRSLNVWNSRHKCPIRGQSVSGGGVTIEFTPTGLGIVVEAKCLCGKKKIIRDL